MTMKKILFLSAMLFTITASCGNDDLTVNQVEYFKDTARNRVFCYTVSEVDSAKIAQWATQKVMHTEGGMSVAFFFKNGSNIPRISMLGSLPVVFEAMAGSDYAAKFTVNASGDKSLSIN